MAIRAVCLDLDDTLWPVRPALLAAEAAIDAYLAAYDPELAAHWPPAARAQRLAEVRAAHPEWAHDVSRLRQQALRELIAASRQPAKLSLSALWAVYFEARNRITPYPDSLAALARLAEHYPLASISNGNADLVRVGLARYFQHRLSAGPVGFAKPDPRIFQLAATRLELPLAQILHVGDDPGLDVAAARQAGMQAAWLNRDQRLWPTEAGPPPEHIFQNLTQLAQALDAH